MEKMSTPNPANEILSFTVPEQYNGFRLDLCLVRFCPDRSRNRIQTLISENHVKVNGTACTRAKTTVAAGDTIELENVPDELPPQEAEPENIPLQVLYEDDSLLAVNKAPGMVVHPAAGNWTGTLVNALLGRESAEFGEMDPLRPGIVHRLDKDTSGCLVVAKTPQALAEMAGSFAERKTSKTYLAIVHGHLPQKSGEIRTLIGRHPVDRKRRAVVKTGGKEAHSAYKVVREGFINGIPASLVEVRIFTGRTHQIRVHMSHIGHPLAGDAMYGGARKLPAPRQMLHSWKLTLPHPKTGKMLSLEAPLPEDFTACLAGLTDKK